MHCECTFDLAKALGLNFALRPLINLVLCSLCGPPFDESYPRLLMCQCAFPNACQCAFHTHRWPLKWHDMYLSTWNGFRGGSNLNYYSSSECNLSFSNFEYIVHFFTLISSTENATSLTAACQQDLQCVIAGPLLFDSLISFFFPLATDL